MESVYEKKKYVLITGASSGIGMEAAKLFANRDFNLILVARRIENLNNIKNDILSSNKQIDIVNIQCDLSIAENAYKLFDEVSKYDLIALINNAGFGNFAPIADQKLDKIQSMLHLNIESLTILSTLFTNKYANAENTQLINVSSVGGYGITGNAVTYCATKFYVSAFTEGLSQELKLANAKMQAKVLAPAATETEFADVSLGTKGFDYKKSTPKFHTAKEMAEFLLQLFDSNKTLGIVNRETYDFILQDSIYPFHNRTQTQASK